jgi:hypothetical protein
MEDRDFFDTLYQLWSKTTGAEDTYWKYEEDTRHYAGGPGTFNIYSVDSSGQEKFVASLQSDEDADFITAVHGSLGDLVRRLHEALDEADSADFNHDSQECRIAELELENARLEGLLAKNGLTW